MTVPFPKLTNTFNESIIGRKVHIYVSEGNEDECKWFVGKVTNSHKYEISYPENGVTLDVCEFEFDDGDIFDICFLDKHMLLFDLNQTISENDLNLVWWKFDDERWEPEIEDPYSFMESQPPELSSLEEIGSFVNDLLEDIMSGKNIQSKYVSLTREQQCTAADLINLGKNKLVAEIYSFLQEKRKMDTSYELSDTDLYNILVELKQS